MARRLLMGEDMSAVKIPTLHLNGTSGEVLRDQWTAAHKAVCDAIAAVCEAGPNARDYYVQGPDAALAAQREHEARVKALRQVRDEIFQIADAIDAQLLDRELARSGK